MRVYIEYIVLNNFFVDVMLLYWAILAAKRRFVLFRVLIGAALGTAVAVLSPFITNLLLSAAVKLILPAAMVLVVVSWQGVKKYFSLFCYFSLFTALLGGIVIALNNFGFSGAVIALDFKNGILAAIVAVISLITTYCVKLCLHKAAEHKRNLKYKKKTRLSIGGAVIESEGFLDSGNKVYENGKPVIFIDKALVLADISSAETGDLIYVNTVNGRQIYPTYSVKSLRVGEGSDMTFFDNVSAVITEKRADRCKIILHGDM